MTDDHGDIQCITGRNSGKTASRKAESPGKTAQKVEYPEQKNAEREFILPEKALLMGKNVEKTPSLHVTISYLHGIIR